MAAKTQGDAEEQKPKVVGAKRRAVRVESSDEDEVDATKIKIDSASDAGPSRKAAPPAKAETVKKKKPRVLEDDDEDDEASLSDEFSEAEDSDSDFASDEEDDFKGKTNKTGKKTGNPKAVSGSRVSASKTLSAPTTATGSRTRNRPVRFASVVEPFYLSLPLCSPCAWPLEVTALMR